MPSQGLSKMQKDRVEYSDLLEAAGMQDTLPLKQLLKSIPSNRERIFKTLWMSDEASGEHSVFLSAALNSCAHAEVILKHVDISSDEGFQLIRYTPANASIWSILSQPSYYVDRKCDTKAKGKAIRIMCSLIVSRVTYSQWVELVQAGDTINRTLIGWSMFVGLAELSIFILNTLTPDDRQQILSMKDIMFWTPLDAVFMQCTFMSKAFTSLLDLIIVNDNKGFQVMKSSFNKLCKSDYKDQNGRYIMSTKRQREYGCDAIKLILEKFSPEYQLDLIEPAGGLESEVERESEEKNVDLHPIIQLLRTRRTRAKMEVILKTPGEGELLRLI